MSNPNDLSEYRSANARVSFRPYEFQDLERRVKFALRVASSAVRYTESAAEYVEAARQLGGLLPGIFPHMGRRPSVSGRTNPGSPMINSTPLDNIAASVGAVSAGLAPRNGAVRPYDLEEMAPGSSKVACGIEMPRNRAPDSFWLDAVSTVEPLAVIAGYSSRSRAGNAIPTRQFSTVIDYTQAEQGARLYYGPDGVAEGDEFFDAVVASLPDDLGIG